MILKSSPLPIGFLTRDERNEMFALMTAHYHGVTRATFDADLRRKNEVILLHDDQEKIRGFTTYAWNPCGEMEAGDVIFSGDTIIDKECWGTQELVKGFCRRAGERQRYSGRRLYWFLISKGHRTYRYLPIFAQRFHPHPEREEPILEKLAGEIAERMFGDAWKPKEGVIRFDQSAGHLKDELAGSPDKNAWVRYFLEKNPGYAHGEELVCITEMSVENLRKIALAAFCEKFGETA